MAPAQSPPAGVKRGARRQSKAVQPPLKKVRTAESTPLPSSSSIASPSVQSPAPSSGTNRLPYRLSDRRPLPTLPTPQPLSLPASTHQSLADSGVLQASLDRSRLRWVHDGVFDRYWTKPEGGKNARPPPPNNPEAKWMKHRGPFRIRVEPHIFECEVYVEERPRQPVPKVQQQPQYRQGGYGGYGAPYAPGQGPYTPGYGQQRRMHTMPQPTPMRHSPAPAASAQKSQQSSPQPEKKAGPDPVISLLANRASSDPELKALMKEVATGSANPEQLKVFQGHIDDLTKIINEKKKKEEEETAAAEAQKSQEQPESIQYDGAANAKPYHSSAPSSAYQTPQQQEPYLPPPPPVQQQPPPPSSAPPVILQFTTPGATEDRFLFPQHTILETLSPQHLLCSTLLIRKGFAAADPSKLNPQTEYFQPLTFMVEVAYGRETLLELVRKWVKPADEVRKHMEQTMARCTRAPEAHLALRLPVKGSGDAETDGAITADEGEGGDDGMGKKKAGPNIKYFKKPGPKKGEGGRPAGVKNGEGGKGAGAGGSAVASAAGTPVANAGAGSLGQTQAPHTTGDGTAQNTGATTQANGEAGEKKDEPEATESGRPKRSTRKSVRISEG